MNEKCHAYKVRILNYFNGNLDAEQSALVLEHIEQCRSCRKLVEDMGVIPHLDLLDETRIEENIAGVREAIQARKREETTATTSGQTFVDMVKEHLQALFDTRLAIPAATLAAAAVAIFAWFVGGSFLDRSSPSLPDTRLAQDAPFAELLTASWLPGVTTKEQANALFEPYSWRKKVEDLQTLGADVMDVQGDPGTPAGLMGRLFAAMALETESRIISTVVLLDRERELLISVNPVPDRVLLRSIDIRDLGGDIFMEQHISLNESMGCLAHAIFRDNASGLTVLFAPGIDRMLSLLEVETPHDCFEAVPGLISAIASGFVSHDADGDESQDRLSGFFYEERLTLQVTDSANGDMMLALSGQVPEGLPDRMPLFSDDGNSLAGILIKTPENDRQVLTIDSIDTIIANIDPILDEARAKYESWFIRLHSNIESYAAEDLPQHLELSASASGEVQFQEDLGYVLRIDLDGDDMPDMAIPIAYPGLVICMH